LDLSKIGLIVEGGGMRAAYTAGVLEAFLDHDIEFSYIVAVSAGSSTSMSYLSKQKGRNKRIYTKWVTDKRFMGVKSIISEHSFFGMNFLFDTLPRELDPFDYETFLKYKGVFKVCATHCDTGKPVYFEPLLENNVDDTTMLIRASSSLPLISPIVTIKGEKYLDGGLSDSIPVQKSIDDGNSRHVLILTRNLDYTKEFSRNGYYTSKLFLKKYPKIVECIKTRHNVYNRTLSQIRQLEADNLAYVFRPQKALNIDRYEKDQRKLTQLYEQGYGETLAKLPDFKAWVLGSSNSADKK
jgi:predicted patatin/cPLA2 family phospholipase